MNLKAIEETVLKHTISALFGLPLLLFGMIVSGLYPFLPDGLKTQPGLKAALAAILLLLLFVSGLVAYAILLSKRLKEKPDFSQFIHDPEKACWINISTGQRICEACKVEGKLVPLSRFGDGWKCPIHQAVVGFHGSSGRAWCIEE